VTSTGKALDRLAAPLRRSTLLAGALGAGGTALVVLGTAAWLARFGAVRAPWWVLAAWAVAAIGAGLALAAARRELHRVAPGSLARGLETTGGFRAGSIRLLLDHPADGVSASLMGAADRLQAEALDTAGHLALAGDRERLGTRTRRTAVIAAAGVLLLASAGSVSGTAALLWRPDLAFGALMAPIEISASAATVERGDSVAVSYTAPGRREAVLWTRAPGESWSGNPVLLDSAGGGRQVIGPLTGDLHARLTAGGRSSDTVTVSVRLPAFLGSLVVTAHYPGYLGIDPEPVALGGDTLLLPEGTRLETDGRATASLVGAAWEGPAGAAPLQVEGERFTGAFIPRSDGAWQLALRTAMGTVIGTSGAELALRLVPDLGPVVEVPVPGQDTVETSGPALALLVDARDDHGLRRLTLETRRNGASIQGSPLELPEGVSDRALLGVSLELAAYGLGPGDTLWYRVVAIDNAPTPQRGMSREMLLVVPTRAALRDAQLEATQEAGQQLDALAEQGRALERATEDLARTRPRPGEGQRPGENPLSLDEARRAEEVARSQESLLDEVRKLEASLEQLQQAAEAAGIADSAFAQRMEEIREELARAMSPELTKKLAALQEALSKLDAPATREALQDLSEAQRQLREALERSQELFERAALEGELGAISQEAQEMAEAQKAWAERMQAADTARAAAEERALAERADSLAADIARAAAEMPSGASQQQMSQAAEAAQTAAAQMRQAAKSASQGQRQQASQQGQQAASQMGEVKEQVDDSRGQQQEEWKSEVLQALDQALLETTRLTSRQLLLAQGFRGGQTAAVLRAEQAAVEEGARQLIEQVMTAGGKNALVPPQIAGALAAARQQMGLAREAIATANLNLREGGDRAGEAVDALNAAAFMLLRARGNVSNSSSGSGMAEAMEQMAQMAQQQGGLGQASASLLPMMGSPGVDQQLQELAARQRQLSRDLDRLRAETNAGAAERFAEEARELAREMEAGRLDPATIARQERLFRRMLDAGRTLQGEEEDERKERESESATGENIQLPPALRSRLLEASGRIRLPTWEELQRYSPEERRLVADYFRRLTGGRP